MTKKARITIGTNLAQLRINKKLSLTELSEKSGVQMATLSRIENNKMTGTLESHLAIAEALGAHLEELYKGVLQRTSPETKPYPVKLIEPFTYEDQAYTEIITRDVTLKKMLPMVIKIEGNGRTKTEAGMNGAEKFIFVLDGEVELNLGEHAFTVKKDTAFYFDAAQNHFLKNLKATPSKILCVRSPVKL